MIVAFWTALAILAFTYVGYPALMCALAKVRPRPIHGSAQTPFIEVVLVVHDCAGLLGAKLENLAALDYPRDRLRVNVVADGCTDGTEAEAAQRLAPADRLFSFPIRRGKSACIGNVLASLEGEILLFTDVRQRLDPGAARALATALADPSVGAAGGELVIEQPGGFGRGIDAYWRYEKMIRRFESDSGSAVSVTGALYAVRRDCLPEVPAGLVLDDMWIPLSIAAHGLRVVFVPQAIARDAGADSPRSEETRKRRTLAGNYQLLHRWPGLAVPGRHPLAWRLWGHKWLRLLAPWLLVLAFAANAVLAVSDGFYALLFALQLVAYATALLGRWSPALLALPPVRLCTAFVSLNFSAGLALLDYLRNPNSHLWQTTRLEGSLR